MIGGVSLAFRNYSRITGSGINYFDGLGLGIKTTLVSVLPFALFIFIYLMIDGAFMETIRQKEMFGSYLNPFLLSFLIAFEGSLSGFFIAFVLMQYYKRRTITE